jgi:NodT family efflux transporter outer membrane factor (OMF) lipoprotein
MKRTLVLLSALLLSACVSAPTTTPQAMELAPKSLGLSGPPAAQFPDEWWKAFHDPQVDRLAALALSGNPNLQGALARIRAAQAELSVARADDLPQASLDGQDQRERFSKNYIIPPPYGGTYQWFGQVEANLTWNIDFWGKQAAIIARARDNAKAAALDAAAARLALSGALAETYINLLLAYQDGDIADQTVAERQQILDLTQGRYNAGLEDESAVEQAKALVALARADQKRTSAQRDTDVHAIAALTGQGASAYATITRPEPNLDTALPLPNELPADLLSRRPDILAAEARVEAAAKGRQAAHADFYPNINLAAFAGFQAIGLSTLFSAGSFTYGAGPAIHLPIFDAGKIRANYAGATADLDSAVETYNGVVLDAVRQTADAMTEVASLESQRSDQQAALDSATRSFSLAQTRYKTGLSDQIVMLNAESTLLTAREQMAALLANSTVQRVSLLLSVGGGFTPARNGGVADAAAAVTPAPIKTDIAKD